MLPSQLESSSPGPSTGLPQGSGLDYLGWGEGGHLGALRHLGKASSLDFSSILLLSLLQVSIPLLGQAQTGLHHVWGGREWWEVPTAPLAAG